MNYKWTKEQLESIKPGDIVTVVDRFRGNVRRREAVAVSGAVDFGFWAVRLKIGSDTPKFRTMNSIDPSTIKRGEA